MNRLEIEFCGFHLENPFVLAASPCTDEVEMVRNAFRAGWAGAVLKSTHVESLVFEPVSPRLWGYDIEDIKMAGLGNIDLISQYHVGIVAERVRELKREFPEKMVIASVAGDTQENWQGPIRQLITAGADAIETSLSCPQGHLGLAPGQSLLEYPELTTQMVKWTKEAAAPLPVFIKLAGHLDQISAARTIKAAGGYAVLARGQQKAIMGVDLDTWVPNPNVAGKSTYASYTGPTTKPACLWNVAQIAKKVGIPIIANGGMATWRDATEAMLLGAGMIEIATAAMRNGFRIIDDLKDGCQVYLEEKGITNISQLLGQALPNIVTQDELPRDYRVVSTVNRDTCIKDDLCYISCRDGGHMAMELGEDRIPVVDEEKCIGCGLCLAVCPVWDCITMKPKK